MNAIAVIPARSGSKGLKDKNIRKLNGKPLLSYSVEAARRSERFSCIHVSTDSEKYADIAREYGADVPFLRIEELAGDTASTNDVIRWTLEKYREMGKNFDTVMILQPTSPLRTAEDIHNAFEVFEERRAEAVVSICKVDHSPLWCNVLPEDGCMKGFLRDSANNRRQTLPDYYRINGAIYLMDRKMFFKKDINLYGEKTYAYIMPGERSVDIDTEFDFLVAEAMIRGVGMKVDVAMEDNESTGGFAYEA